MADSQNIAVAGAGLAGLSAAKLLHDAGHSVTIYEARDRVGGRVWSEDLRVNDDVTYPIERGAEFILDGYDELTKLASGFNLALVDSGMSYYKREPVDYPHLSIEDLARAGRELTSSLSEKELGLSVDEILNRYPLPEDVAEALRARIEISAALPAIDVPGSALAHAASFVGAQSWRIQGGNQRLCESLQESMQASVRFNEPLSSIANIGNGSVRITSTSDPEDYDYCVVALPLEVVRQSNVLHSDLPADRRDLLERINQGHAAKMHVPLNAVPDVSATMSVSNRYWCWTAQHESDRVAPVLNAFIGNGNALDALMGHEQTADRWYSACRDLRPDLDLGDTASKVFTNWRIDEYAQGAYSGRRPGLAEEELLPLEEPMGKIVLAGEYLGRDYIGLMEGAIRSGYRAAEHVLRAADGGTCKTG